MYNRNIIFALLAVLLTLAIKTSAQNNTMADFGYGVSPQCSFEGYLFNDVCVCDSTHATIDPMFPCNHQRKSQETAFWLSLLLGWLGVGFFYLGLITYAIISFVNFMVIIVGFILKYLDSEEECGRCPFYFKVAGVLFGFAWYLFQLIGVAVNYFNDSHDIGMRQW